MKARNCNLSGQKVTSPLEKVTRKVTLENRYISAQYRVLL